MPRGRIPEGEHTLSNAERQARYRARREADQPAPAVRYRQPVDRRSRLQRWNDLIDLDAGPIATGEKTIEQVGWELFQLMLDVASGRKQVWADKWGLHNDLTLFNPAPVT